MYRLFTSTRPRLQGVIVVVAALVATLAVAAIPPNRGRRT